MLTNFREFVRKANNSGIPVPLVRDPKTGRGSVSLTLVFISNTIVLVGLLGKAANFFGGIDLTQALYWFGICVGIYFSRTVVKNKDTVTLENKEKENND